MAVQKDEITPGVLRCDCLGLSRIESLNKICLRVYSMHQSEELSYIVSILQAKESPSQSSKLKYVWYRLENKVINAILVPNTKILAKCLWQA